MRIAWNAAGSRYFEAGVDRGVLYVGTAPGIPWVGLTGVEESPNGAETKAYYIDGVKYLQMATLDEYEATISAYTYPVEFSKCDGTGRIRGGLFFGQQRRQPFGFSYRTAVGNDTEGAEHGYKIHIVYNALAAPSQRSASSISDSLEPATFSWGVTTKSRPVSGSAPTAHIIVDSRYTHPVTLGAIEDILYGTEGNEARLPLPNELIDIFDVPVGWEVFDNEDGTYTIKGPDENVQDIGLDTILIDHPDVTIIDEDSFTITY